MFHKREIGQNCKLCVAVLGFKSVKGQVDLEKRLDLEMKLVNS